MVKRLRSFVYSFPPDMLEFYFGHLPLAEAKAAALRQDLLAFGVFKESGDYTLRAPVTAETVPQLRQAYDFILRQMAEIAGFDAEG